QHAAADDRSRRGSADRAVCRAVHADGYPRALESSVIAVAEAVAQLRELRHRFGPRGAVWRYDPVVFAAGMDAAAHQAEFTALAGALAGTGDGVALSVMTPYTTTRRH